MDDDANPFDSNDLTIVDGGALPLRVIERDITRPHETDPGIMAVASGARELPTASEWELGFRVGCAANTADLRRAALLELIDRGTPASVAEEFWQSVLARAADPDGQTG